MNGDLLSNAHRVWFRLIRLETRIRLAIANQLKSIGLSIAQCDVLTTLTERDGLSQKELADRLYVTKGNISGLIDRLEAARLVERRTIAGDKRSHAIYLTPEGRAHAKAGIEVQEKFVAKTLGQMEAKDLAALERLLNLARDIVRENDVPPTAVEL